MSEIRQCVHIHEPGNKRQGPQLWPSPLDQEWSDERWWKKLHSRVCQLSRHLFPVSTNRLKGLASHLPRIEERELSCRDPPKSQVNRQSACHELFTGLKVCILPRKFSSSWTCDVKWVYFSLILVIGLALPSRFLL